MKKVDIVIIGGGPAGMAAAVKAYDSGVKDILILERDVCLGGILNQCIHNGFGLHTFKQELTGPEYSKKYIDMIAQRNIPYMLSTMALSIEDKMITAINEQNGIFQIMAKSIILCMGCRERTRGAINIAGERCSGVFNAGTAQKYINIYGLMPGKEVVILGSGDIGLIMARRMRLEGANVKAVLEILPYSGGLVRNIVQCLDDFDIPLKLSHTIVKIHGKDRVEGVTIAKVDESKNVIEDSYEYIKCDTVLLSVGLIPENELVKNMGVTLHNRTGGAYVDQNRQTDIEGIFSCGNALHVHDLVDFVSEEAYIAGRSAAKYVMQKCNTNSFVAVIAKDNISYVVPQKIIFEEDMNVKFMFRVNSEIENGVIKIFSGNTILYEKNKRKLAPGEMESVLLNLKGIDKHCDIEVGVWTKEN